MQVTANNSFNPNPLRSTNNMAGRACHVVGSTTQVGLTQALGISLTFPGIQMFKNLIPKIFYDRLQDGLEFFVDGLGFDILYQDAEMAVIARDGAKAYIVQSPECAANDRPELGIDTDDVDEVF